MGKRGFGTRSLLGEGVEGSAESSGRSLPTKEAEPVRLAGLGFPLSSTDSDPVSPTIALRFCVALRKFLNFSGTSSSSSTKWQPTYSPGNGRGRLVGRCARPLGGPGQGQCSVCRDSSYQNLVSLSVVTNAPPRPPMLSCPNWSPEWTEQLPGPTWALVPSAPAHHTH